jgi:HPt (histidine-containing phosphotransfer) domain-containing protein
LIPPELLEEMRAEYAQSLRARLERIPGSSGEELLRIVHSIAGSAGTFGFPEVSEAAMALEADLQENAAKARIDEGIARLFGSAGFAPT